MNSYLRFEQKLIGNIGHEDDDEVWIGKIKQLYCRFNYENVRKQELSVTVRILLIS